METDGFHLRLCRVDVALDGLDHFQFLIVFGFLVGFSLDLQSLQPVPDQLGLHAAGIVLPRYHAVMRELIAEGARPSSVSGDRVSMVSLAEISEPRGVPKRQNLSLRIGFGRENPVKLDEVVHINPCKVVIRNGEFGQIDLRRMALEASQRFVRSLLHLFGTCACYAGGNRPQVRSDEVDLGLVDAHATGALCGRIVVAFDIEELPPLVQVQHETVELHLQPRGRNGSVVRILLSILVFVDVADE